MKKYSTIFIILLFIGLFASPYILDYWQWKGALNATGAGLSVTEGFKSSVITNCVCSPPIAACASCMGGAMCSSVLTPSAVTCPMYQSVSVTMSAGGMKCTTGYLLTLVQGSLLQGAQNSIIGGTTCTNLQVVASEKGCLGCTASINNPKVYAFKNKMKEIIDFIIAGSKSINN
jgi:hypothetical protein